MQESVPIPTASREIIEIESDTDDDDDPFSPFLNLDSIDGAFPDIPDYVGSSSSEGEQEQVSAPDFVAPDRFGTPQIIVTDAEVLYQLYSDKVLEVFPDICRSHLKVLYETHTADLAPQRSQQSNEVVSQAVIVEILDSEKYPKEKDGKKKLKRKRTQDSDGEEDEHNYAKSGRARLTAAEIPDARILLLWEFDSVPLQFIDAQLKLCGNLYSAYLAIELAHRNYHQTLLPPYKKLVKSRRSKPGPSDYMSSTEPQAYGPVELRKELLAAKRKREREDEKTKQQQLAADADAALDKECMEKGEMVECQCCFTDTPIPKSTHCDESHFFCLECARSHVKSQIELSRYEITCIDGSGCKAPFTRNEKHRFLDTKLLGVLDRLQQQADLRVADMEGLESCPFCDYAAICPPVEEDKEFRCRMPDCETVSCRLCKVKSHLPMTCAEHKKEQGVSERHVLEEAMTNALVRPCPKCSVAILKEGGCNKMVCTKCATCVCDYCGKDISKEGYSHFDNGQGIDPLTGKKKKCPTQDNTFDRNQKRVQEAQKEAMEKVRAENPELSEEDLKIKFSTEVANETNPERHYAIAMPPAWRPGLDDVRRIEEQAQQRRAALLRQRAFRREAGARNRFPTAVQPGAYIGDHIGQPANAFNMPIDPRGLLDPLAPNNPEYAFGRLATTPVRNQFEFGADTFPGMLQEQGRTARPRPEPDWGLNGEDGIFTAGPGRAHNSPFIGAQHGYNPNQEYPLANPYQQIYIGGRPGMQRAEAPPAFGMGWQPTLTLPDPGGFPQLTADQAFTPRIRPRMPGRYE